MILLLLLGLFIGVFGTMIGVGGGFLLTPILILLYPEMSAATITSISMMVVCLNAGSGSFAYSRLKRIDYKAGLICAISSLPGVIAGTLMTAHMPRQTFNAIFSWALILIATVLIVNPYQYLSNRKQVKHSLQRIVIDADGKHYAYSFNILKAVTFSVVTGFVSGLLGIGGGIIHVPGMIMLLNFPVHIATATSHFILAITSSFSTVTHMLHRDFNDTWAIPLFIAPGVIIGAQIGAICSKRIDQVIMIRSVAAALIIAAMKILFF